MLVTFLLILVTLTYWVAGNPGDDLYLIKLYLTPTQGRDEVADFTEIKKIIHETEGVDAILSMKEIGNPLMYNGKYSFTFSSILENTGHYDYTNLRQIVDEDTRSWSRLTSQLSRRGDEYTSWPLYSCKDFANELNVSFPTPTKFKHVPTHLSRLTFPIQGRSQSEYLELLANFLQHIGAAYQQGGWDMICFRKLIDIPFQLFLFTNEPATVEFDLANEMNAGRDFQIHEVLVHDLQHYVDTCLA